MTSKLKFPNTRNNPHAQDSFTQSYPESSSPSRSSKFNPAATKKEIMAKNTCQPEAHKIQPNTRPIDSAQHGTKIILDGQWEREVDAQPNALDIACISKGEDPSPILDWYLSGANNSTSLKKIYPHPSLIYTPISAEEICSIFNLTADFYERATENKDIPRSYTDFSDPLQRLRLHNISDALFFAVKLSLGWPIVPHGEISDLAEEITDELALSWEEVEEFMEIPFFYFEPNNYAIKNLSSIDLMRLKMRLSIKSVEQLSGKRQEALIRYTDKIFDIFDSRSASAPGTPDQRVRLRRDDGLSAVSRGG